MIQRKATFFLGIFIFLIPFLGFPTFWKTIFVVVSGGTLVLLSVKIEIPKKSLKPRVKKVFTPGAAETNFVRESSIPAMIPPQIVVPSVESMPISTPQVSKPRTPRKSVTKKSNGQSI